MPAAPAAGAGRGGGLGPTCGAGARVSGAGRRGPGRRRGPGPARAALPARAARPRRRRRRRQPHLSTAATAPPLPARRRAAPPPRPRPERRHWLPPGRAGPLELGTSGCLHTPPSRGRERVVPVSHYPAKEVTLLGPGRRRLLASCGRCSRRDPREGGEAPGTTLSGAALPAVGRGPGVAGWGRPISARRGPGAGLPLPAGAGLPARRSERSRERESERLAARGRQGPPCSVSAALGAEGCPARSPLGSWQRPAAPPGQGRRGGGPGSGGSAVVPRSNGLSFVAGSDAGRAAHTAEGALAPSGRRLPSAAGSTGRPRGAALPEPARSLARARTDAGSRSARGRALGPGGSRCPRSRRDPLVLAGVRVPSNAGASERSGGALSARTGGLSPARVFPTRTCERRTPAPFTAARGRRPVGERTVGAVPQKEDVLVRATFHLGETPRTGKSIKQISGCRAPGPHVPGCGHGQ
ncbi:translation initiation factor IF-2-like [Neovison vison]|uniref:translation initiation factor IF-2-like n=1 Tax=Neovison vison TaxID=452646 RepID=UPI001CF0AEA3|nr:translation initiation factor IF-2-like [Neogale vison]